MKELRLDANENTRGPSPKVLDVLRRLTLQQLAEYPNASMLSEALTKRLGVEAEQLLITAGADEALYLACSALACPGGEVVLLEPSFSQYSLFCDRLGLKIKRVRCEKRFPAEAFLDAIDDETQLVVIATPNNPTGTLASPPLLQEVAKRLSGGTLLIDEAYGAFAHVDNLSWAAGCDNVVVLRTFSKAYGLASLRVGYMVGPKELIQRARRFQLPYGVNSLAISAAVAALSDDLYIERYVDEVAQMRHRISDVLRSLGADVWPSAANFLWANFGRRAEAVYERLCAANIWVRRFEDYPDFLRITLGDAEAMGRLIETLLAPCLVLFDMDGVLIDESRSYRPCIQETIRELVGSAPSLEEIAARKAQGGVNCDFACVAAFVGDRADHALIASRFNRLYWERFVEQEQWILSPALLRELRKRCRLGIVTGRPRRDALYALERFGMRSLFDVVVTADDVSEGKPSPEGLQKAMGDVWHAVYVGDLPDDEQAASAAGLRYVQVGSPDQLLEALFPGESKRTAYISRISSETAIDLRLSLDGVGEGTIESGLGFFDHMLRSFCKHGLFNLQLACRGDLEVDDHHTLEDVGICLGQAVDKALGDKRGIARAGFFLFPMDEALASCAIDLSGRSQCSYEGAAPGWNLLPFFEGFARGSLATIHLQIHRGEDPHHRAEALFKAFGKALRMACAIESRAEGQIPSTKGML